MATITAATFTGAVRPNGEDPLMPDTLREKLGFLVVAIRIAILPKETRAALGSAIAATATVQAENGRMDGRTGSAGPIDRAHNSLMETK